MRKTKFICFVLSLAMVFSTVSFVFGNSLSDINTNEHKEAIETLYGLNLVSGYSDGTYSPDKTLTRAEFTAIVVRALGYKINGVYATQFSDVAADYWASGYIATANGLGIIYGYGDGTFRPTASVTYGEAIAMVMRALGYSQNYGEINYPYGYVMIASGIDVLENVDYATLNAPINRGEMAQLVYNALDCDIHNFTAKGFDLNKNETMMKRLGVTKTEGMMVYTENTLINIIEKVGQYGYTYKNKDGKIVAFVATSEAFTGKVKNGKLIVGDSKYTVPTTSAAAIVNAEVIGTKSIASYEGKTVTLNCKMSGSTIDKLYSIVEWSGVDKQLTKSTIYNEKKNTLAGIEVPKSELTFIVNGASNVSEFAVDDVVTIYLNSKKELVRVDGADSIISGVVQKLYVNNGVNYYTINGVEYTAKQTLTLGVNYKCYLNAEGVIVKAVVINGTDYSSYVIYCGDATEAFGEHYIAYYTVSSPDKYVKSDVSASVAGLSAGDLITFTTSAGKVNTITKATTASAIQWTGYVFTVDGKSYLPADDIAIWAYDGEDYSIVSTSSLEKKTNLTAGAAQYALKDGQVISLVVDASNSSAISSTGYAVINSQGVKLNSAKESVNCFDGYVDGVEVSDVETLSSSVVIPSASGLYKVEYTNSAVKRFTPVSAISLVCADESGRLISDGHNWYVLDEDVIVYVYDKTYNIGAGISVDDKITLYDTSKTADNVYDVVIIWE